MKKKLTMIYVVLAAALVCALRVGYAAEEITLPVGFVPNVQFAPLGWILAVQELGKIMIILRGE